MPGIIREPAAMERFAAEIDEYCESMRRVCNELNSNLSSAAPHMKDKSSKALQRLENLASDLISGLPEAQNAAEKLRAAAKPLKEADSINF
jgi:hypothetical protein